MPGLRKIGSAVWALGGRVVEITAVKHKKIAVIYFQYIAYPIVSGVSGRPIVLLGVCGAARRPKMPYPLSGAILGLLAVQVIQITFLHSALYRKLGKNMTNGARCK